MTFTHLLMKCTDQTIILLVRNGKIENSMKTGEQDHKGGQKGGLGIINTAWTLHWKPNHLEPWFTFWNILIFIMVETAWKWSLRHLELKDIRDPGQHFDTSTRALQQSIPMTLSSSPDGDYWFFMFPDMRRMECDFTKRDFELKCSSVSILWIPGNDDFSRDLY